MRTEARRATVTNVPSHRYLVFFGVAVGGALWDLATKSLVFQWLGAPQTGESYWIVPQALALTTHYNRGALFGMGQGLNFVFAGLSVVAAAGILYWLFVRGAARDGKLNVALALIMAGVIGNLYDRLGLHGLRDLHGEPIYAVRDFIYFALIDWPIFNFADSFLVSGAALLLLLSFQAPVTHPEPARQGTNSA